MYASSQIISLVLLDIGKRKKDYGKPIGEVKSYADQGVTTTVTTLALDSGPERWVTHSLSI